MNRREMLLKSINHFETERVPIDFSGHRSSGIMIQTYKKLREYLNLKPSKLYIYDLIQQLALVEDDVLNIVGGDVVELGHNYYMNEDYWKDWVLEDGTSCKIPHFIQVEKTKNGNILFGDENRIIGIQKKGCLYFEQTYYPIMDREGNEFENLQYDIKQITWCRVGTPPAPITFDEKGLEKLKKTAKNLRETTERAIYATFGGNLMEMGQFYFRMEKFLFDLAANPKEIHKFLDKMTEIHMENLTKFVRTVGENVDIIGFGDDLGMQTGPLISPEMYREFFKPRHKEIWGQVKKLFPDLKTSLHCCGGIYPLIPDLIDAGIDIINPVQFVCKDMDLERLKKEFGKDLVLWGGGCDTKEILPLATPEQIKRHVIGNVNKMKVGGGFVFQQVHNIMFDVPPENIMAMFEAVNS